ncbi:MAG: helix-turn-helix domain-containing protein [Gammaproteobacteria bacterium]|nr:MAG: helix-turn-helix domain-containing protein [Gammaproteobacteria bacterium]
MNKTNARPRFEPDDMLDDEALGLYLDVTPQHIRCSRMKKATWEGPPYIEISPKVKRYLFSDVLSWAKERRKNPADRFVAA